MRLPYTYTYDMVFQVEIRDNTPYVISLQGTAGFIGNDFSRILHYFVRQDRGNHWQAITSLPWREITSLLPWQAMSIPRQFMPQTPEQANYYPRTACRPNEPQTCYRITDLAQNEFTQDRGEQWQVVWKSPEIRQSYLRSYIEYHRLYIYC